MPRHGSRSRKRKITIENEKNKSERVSKKGLWRQEERGLKRSARQIAPAFLNAIRDHQEAGETQAQLIRRSSRIES
jgi:hypothetical protein